jgi:hypothetical protein
MPGLRAALRVGAAVGRARMVARDFALADPSHSLERGQAASACPAARLTLGSGLLYAAGAACWRAHILA